jgi:multidrug resistance efflux pump
MGQSTNVRAKGASSAGNTEAPQPAISITSVRAGLRAAQTTESGEKMPRFSGLDISGHWALLRDAFEKRPRMPDDAQKESLRNRLAALAGPLAGQRSKVLKALCGVLVLAAVGYLPVRTLLQTASTEAIVNARLITLRAPIEGEVAQGLGSLAVGTEINPGTPLMRIANTRADRGRLDDLRRQVQRLEGERSALTARRDDLKALHADLAAQTQAFAQGRERQLELRMAELASEIAGAEANREEADRALERATPLAATKTMTAAAYEKAKRDARVAAEAQSALRHRLAAVEVELASLRKGVFIGDSYNDRPRSSQRADELAQRLSEVSADIRERDALIASLQGEIADETRRFEAVAAAELAAPVRASVWEVMTAPGETVVRGQDLMRLLDCSGVVVTATVGETAYNRLKIGGNASFRLRGESTDHQGRIIGLTGVATAPANLAIQPSALAKEPYRVTVALPDLAKAGRCDIGRTGRVTFEN